MRSLAALAVPRITDHGLDMADAPHHWQASVNMRIWSRRTRVDGIWDTCAALEANIAKIPTVDRDWQSRARR